jgi:hypothetical protein
MPTLRTASTASSSVASSTVRIGSNARSSVNGIPKALASEATSRVRRTISSAESGSEEKRHV